MTNNLFFTFSFLLFKDTIGFDVSLSDLNGLIFYPLFRIKIQFNHFFI